MRINTENLSIKDIVEQKKVLIKSKKSLPITSEPLSFAPDSKYKSCVSVKAAAGEDSDPNKLKVTVIGNTTCWCDSHMDVIAPGAFKKTIEENGSYIAHLRDHYHSLEGKIGKTLKVYTGSIQLRELGIEDNDRAVEALFMDSEVMRKWDEKIFAMYADKAVDQHSIGFQYMRIELAVNDAEGYPEEYKIWSEAFPLVINKEKVLERGYFWYVTEVKLYEISAVLFGSNVLTPTVSTEEKGIPTPPTGTLEDTDSDAADSTSDEEMERRLIQLNY